jgi:DNA polymerase III epsilon subunit-like protein
VIPRVEPLLLPQPLGVRDLAFAVIDLETTGGVPRATWDREGRFRPACEITEVGVVRMQGPLIQGTYTSLCGIEGPLPDLIQRLTGITPRLLKGAPPWERVALRLAEELEGRLWVAHNAGFDGSFLEAWLPEGLWHRHRMLCTLKLARRLIPEAPRKSLGALVTFLDLSNRNPHRALPDAEATAELLQHLMDRAEAQGWDAERLLKEGGVPWKGARNTRQAPG